MLCNDTACRWCGLLSEYMPLSCDKRRGKQTRICGWVIAEFINTPPTLKCHYIPACWWSFSVNPFQTKTFVAIDDLHWKIIRNFWVYIELSSPKTCSIFIRPIQASIPLRLLNRLPVSAGIKIGKVSPLSGRQSRVIRHGMPFQVSWERTAILTNLLCK